MMFEDRFITLSSNFEARMNCGSACVYRVYINLARVLTDRG
jgi:hypothetical protein